MIVWYTAQELHHLGALAYAGARGLFVLWNGRRGVALRYGLVTAAAFAR